AVIPVGYSDGLTLMPASIAQRAYHPMRVLGRRLLGSNEQNCVTVRDKRVPIIGRVSMQMTSIDVTDVPAVEIGDEVIISSRRTTTSSRIPRTYLDLQ
ncbi:MAG: alanine racemase, partial [Armatimonadetes bacterium]|nr:alanine racemase [Armatimonadota bacterium]